MSLLATFVTVVLCLGYIALCDVVLSLWVDEDDPKLIAVWIGLLIVLIAAPVSVAIHSEQVDENVRKGQLERTR